MKKKGIYFFVIVVFCFCNWSSLMAKIESQATPVYKDPNKPVNERVEDLISKMTIDEKIGQLSSKFNYKNKPQPEDVLIGHIRNPAIFCSEKGYLTASECAKVNNDVQKEFIEKSRLGIPAIVHDETLHGVCGCGYGTSYPQSIAMAATFDPDLYREAADAISDEVKVLGIHQVLSPVLNISRDPRWGRVQETYGEDPYLSSAMGYQFVNTFEKKGVVATPKHFVATVGDGGRDSYAMYCSERQLRELYFPPFETCVKKAGVRSLMVAYNSLNGVPCHSDAWLIETILRSEWGFSGIVVTDYEGIGGTWGRFNVATSHKLGILESYKAGVDVDLPDGGKLLKEMFKEGIIDEKRIDKHLRRILTLKFELGIFDTPYVDQKKADEVVHSKKHVDIALKAARESIVLLKNNNKTLPLNKKKIKKIAVFGPAADTPALGNYARGIIGNEITPLKGLHEIAGKDVEVILRKPGEDVVALAKSVDAAIVCVTIIEDEGLDRSNLDLPVIKRNIVAKTQEDEAMGLIVSPWKRDLEKGDQEALIKAVASSGTPTIVVMVNGSPITMQNWINDANAIIEPWYGGERSGIALAEVIFGEYNPAGRLPMTFPKTIGQVPLYYNFSPSGRGYAYHDMDEKPQFEFGFGLSYTTFEYSNARLSSDKMPLKELKNKVKVSVDVKNTGDREGDEVAQLYIRDAFSSVVQPLKALKGFKRIALKPGEIKTVTFELGKEELGLWNRDMKFVVEPGEFEVFIGSSCEKRQVPKLSFSISD